MQPKTTTNKIRGRKTETKNINENMTRAAFLSHTQPHTNSDTQNWRYRVFCWKKMTWCDSQMHISMTKLVLSIQPATPVSSFVCSIFFSRPSIACENTNLTNSVFMCVVTRFHSFHQFWIDPFYTLKFRQTSISCTHIDFDCLMIERLERMQAHAWRFIVHVRFDYQR